ncbi:MAG: hypothetical protein MUC49_14925 [Raineya sp.]|jgi:hypothetical protein|nr:hypothetical protein [Raineya sp.]
MRKKVKKLLIALVMLITISANPTQAQRTTNPPNNDCQPEILDVGVNNQGQLVILYVDEYCGVNEIVITISLF